MSRRHHGHGSGRSPRRLSSVVCLLLLCGCSSPEAARSRGGGSGGDVRNWGHPVELHAGAEPYYRTPCVTGPIECTGPPSSFGTTPPPD